MTKTRTQKYIRKWQKTTATPFNSHYYSWLIKKRICYKKNIHSPFFNNTRKEEIDESIKLEMKLRWRSVSNYRDARTRAEDFKEHYFLIAPQPILSFKVWRFGNLGVALGSLGD